MIIFKQSSDLQRWLKIQREKGMKAGFVPTMGALHDGHLRLIRASRANDALTVCSIFVNPTQFNDHQDFKKYPITTENDILLLEKQGTDALFLPSADEIYRPGEVLEKYELGNLEDVFEGHYRPGHFQGVCQVMSRLLGRVSPDDLFMGQKDFQQCLVVKKLIAGLGLSVRFHTVATEREPDGLAMSSRNTRLNPEQRSRAVAIFKALTCIRENLAPGDTTVLIQKALNLLKAAEFRTDYAAIARADDLQPLTEWNGTDKIVALIAAFQGEVRLIDNMLLN